MKTFIQLLSVAICLQCSVYAQTHTKKADTVAKPAAKENYIGHEIAKNGPGDHSIFYDTLANALKPTDAFNAAGKQYQDIKVTLAEGDAINTDLRTGNGGMMLTLFNSANGKLQPVKAITDTASYYAFKLLYKAATAGIYTLRVSSKKKLSKDKYEKEYYYENSASYRLNTVVATPASGLIADGATICEQLQFLMRQRLTYYTQITGNVVDSTIDVLDKTKIQSINHISSFTFYKNSVAKIQVDPFSLYITFNQLLLYKDGDDAAMAQRYFINSFKDCLGEGWKGETDDSDADWYKFKKSGGETISVILYRKYNYVEVLL